MNSIVEPSLIHAFLEWVRNRHSFQPSTNSKIVAINKISGKVIHIEFNYKLNEYGMTLYHKFCEIWLKIGKSFIDNLNQKAKQNIVIIKLAKLFDKKAKHNDKKRKHKKR